jgi:hypothetical protein
VGGLFNGPNSVGGQTRNFIARMKLLAGLATLGKHIDSAPKLWGILPST